MYEILKTLAEEPEKLNKILIKSVRMLLILMLSNTLYTWVLDRSLVNHISNPNEWLQLIEQGYLIVFVFLFIVSYIALFIILPALFVWILPLTKWIVRGIAKKVASDLDKGVSHGLVIVNVIERKFQGKRMKAGRNFDDFYAFFKTVTGKNTQHDNYSLGSETLETFIAFIVIYYFFIGINVTNYFIDVSLIILIVNFSIVYAISSLFIEFLTKNKTAIKYMLDWLKAEKMIFNLLERNGVKIQEIKDEIKLGVEDYFVLGENTYYFNYKSIKFKRYAEIDEQLLMFLNENPKSYVLRFYLDKQIEDEAIILSETVHERLINFTYQNRKELKAKFKAYFKHLI